MDIAEYSDALVARLREQARLFTEDNFRHPTPSDHLVILNAFMCGAATVAAFQTEREKENADSR